MLHPINLEVVILIDPASSIGRFRDVEVTNDVRVGGNIITENYIVSSSVTYMTQSFSSGSTIFGDTSDDTHKFTALDTINSIEMNSLNPSVTLASIPHGGTPVIRFVEGTNFRGGFVKFDGLVMF